MRKSMTVLLLVIQISLLFFFSNINSLLDEVDKKESSRIEIKNRVSPQSLHVIRGIKKFFSYFVIIIPSSDISNGDSGKSSFVNSIIFCRT